MRIRGLGIGYIVALCLFAPVAMAEEKSKLPVDTPLRITVVFSEYDGSKKLTNLPYEMPCNASSHNQGSALKIGFRVPYKVGQGEIQYQDVGTNVNCSAVSRDERGRYVVQLKVAHMTIAQWHPGAPLGEDPAFGGEVVAELRNLPLHDGQTIEALSATDSVTGHTWKVDVTLNVVK